MDLSYGQRSWMVSHIADGLRTLGLDVTPQAVEQELARMDDLMHGTSAVRAAAAHSDPPDAYAPGIATRRAAAATPQATFAERWKAERTEQLARERTLPRPQARPLTDADRRRLTPPDPYTTRKETR